MARWKKKDGISGDLAGHVQVSVGEIHLENLSKTPAALEMPPPPHLI